MLFLLVRALLGSCINVSRNDAGNSLHLGMDVALLTSATKLLDPPLNEVVDL